MLNTNNKVLLFAEQLPALPQAVIRLLEICNAPDTEIGEVSRIVAQDVMITARILKLANSSFFGARSTFVNIEHAVVYLGIDSVRNLVIAIAVHETFTKQPSLPNQALEKFWHHSLFSALLAKEIAQLSGCHNPAEAYLAGFLHDIGKILLSCCFAEEYEPIFEQYHGLKLLQKEREVLGISHAEAGAGLVQHWNLDDSLSRAIAQHHFPFADLPDDQPLSRVTALANLLADNHPNQQTLIKQAAKQLQISSDALAAVRSNQLENVQEVAESLGVAVSLPEQSAPTDTLREKVESLAQISGLLDNLIRAKTLNRVFLIAEESLQILFDVEKSIVLLPDDENIRLTVHGSFRNRLAHRLKDLQIPADDETSQISRILGDQQSGHIDKRSEISPAETRLFDTFAEESLLAVTFTLGETQRGVLLVAAAGETAPMGSTLLLLASHIGSRLYLEKVKNRQAEALARERTTSLEAIARTLAHEIANPLAIIQNYISLLGSRNNGNQTRQEDLGIISAELERIGKISRQLNDLSTPPPAKDQELTNIHALIGETLQLFQQAARVSKNVSVEYIGDPQLPGIWIRAGCLRQILINLLSNSLDAVTTNGWIRIESRFNPAIETARSQRITLMVADNGSGIAPAIADQIFRAGHSTKGNGHAGLGLAIVKKLATDLQGKISHSSGINGETLFTLDLPVTSEHPA